MILFLITALYEKLEQLRYYSINLLQNKNYSIRNNIDMVNKIDGHLCTREHAQQYGNNTT